MMMNDEASKKERNKKARKRLNENRCGSAFISSLYSAEFHDS